jgi:hypothetical protein
MHYAEALLKLGRLQTSAAMAMAASGKKQSLLLARIKRLIHRSDKNISYSFHSLLFSFFTLIIAFGMIASFPAKISKDKIVITTQEPEILNGRSNQEVAVIGLTPAAKRSIENNRSKIPGQIEPVIAKAVDKTISRVIENKLELSPEIAKATPQIDPDYLIKVNTAIDLDSFTQVLPEINSALNKQFVLTPQDYNQVLSYRNFKQLETMLALTGDSVTIKESDVSKDSYKKMVTIETTDKNGNKHVYNVVIELYQ